MIEENQTSPEELTVGHIYEHPFTDRMRLFLRLEIIFTQAESSKAASDQYETQLCLNALFALHDLTIRYEIRAELLRELDRIRQALTQASLAPDADMRSLNDSMRKVVQYHKTLHELSPEHIGRARNIKFLNEIRNKKTNDLAAYLFELPPLQYWMSRTASERQRQIRPWLNELAPLKKILNFILQFTRQNKKEEALTAENGAYIRKMEDLYSADQLLRIILPSNSNAFPRLTGGKSRFVIRFMVQKQVDMKALQSAKHVAFKLHTCSI